MSTLLYLTSPNEKETVLSVIERSSPLPLYYQLKEVLKQQIQAGHLAPHTSVPSEPELVEQYRISRATVRQALNELVREGLIYRQHGRGTFVNEPAVAQQQLTSTISSFSDELRRRGKQPGGLLLVSELVRGEPAVRELFGLVDGDQVLRLERVRTADGAPVAHEVDMLPYPRVAGVYQRAQEVAEGSLYALMRSEGLHPFSVEQSFKAGRAAAREAELLRVGEGLPGIRLIATTYDETGVAMAQAQMFCVRALSEVHVTLPVRAAR